MKQDIAKQVKKKTETEAFISARRAQLAKEQAEYEKEQRVERDKWWAQHVRTTKRMVREIEVGYPGFFTGEQLVLYSNPAKGRDWREPPSMWGLDSLLTEQQVSVLTAKNVLGLQRVQISYEQEEITDKADCDMMVGEGWDQTNNTHVSHGPILRVLSVTFY